MTLDKRKLAINFGKAAKTYTADAALQKLITSHLIERLQLIKITPQLIVDAGSGAGEGTRQLVARYKKASVVALDLSLEMLCTARSLAPKFFHRRSYVCGDVEKNPLREHIADLVFSSLALQWCDDLQTTCLQIKNTLKSEGLFIFATLGTDTMKELRASWSEVDTYRHVNAFLDIRDVGNILMRVGFVDPVLDVEQITMTYADTQTLMRDIKQVGASNVNIDRAQGLTGKGKLQNLATAYEKWRVDGRLPVTYEIIYGHAWAPLTAQSGRLATIPITSIKTSKR